MCGQRFWFTLFGVCAVVYTIVTLTFHYEWDQSCKGDWGILNPTPEEKNGKGFCHVKFELFWRFSSVALISWESSYDGQWKNGEKHGKGIFLSFSGLVYDGDWNYDLRHGNGKMTLKDGTTFSGNWIQDRFEGHQNTITITLPKQKYPEAWRFLNGSKYEGSVVDGLAQGIGSLTLGNDVNSTSSTIQGGIRKFQGEWVQGLFIGTGGKLLLCGNIVASAVYHNSRWGINTYIVESKWQLEILGKEFEYFWNGNQLIEIGDENKTLPITQRSKSMHYFCDNRKERIHPAEILSELLDSLLALKWFEFHGLLAQNGVRMEPFAFHKVDKPQNPESLPRTPQRQNKEL